MKELALALGLVGIIFVTFRMIWHRHRIVSLLSRHTAGPQTLAEIRDRLTEINAACSDFVFSVDRYANIAFRGRTVSVVFGDVGMVGIAKAGPMWRMNKTLFAVADAEQSLWMSATRDVFTPAFIGQQSSVFWISISKF